LTGQDEKTKNSASSPQEQVSTGDSANPTTDTMLIPEDDDCTLKFEKDCYAHRVLSDQVLSLHVLQELSPIVSASKAMEKICSKTTEFSTFFSIYWEKESS